MPEYQLRENEHCTWELLRLSDGAVIATSTHPQPLETLRDRLMRGEHGGTWPRSSQQ